GDRDRPPPARRPRGPRRDPGGRPRARGRRAPARRAPPASRPRAARGPARGHAAVGGAAGSQRRHLGGRRVRRREDRGRGREEAPVKRLLPVLALLGLPAAAAVVSAPEGPSLGAGRDWAVYGGGRESLRYSTLRQIDRDNVKSLEVAWTFDSGDAYAGSEMQCNPLVIDGVLYATTPKVDVIALDAATGALKWRFDPHQ